MLIIPLQAVPNQIVAPILGGQSCSIKVYQKFFGLYVDLSVNGTLLIGGQIALNLVKIVRDSYLGFLGDLAFIDNQGSSDPYYTGLADRYSLAYLQQGVDL